MVAASAVCDHDGCSVDIFCLVWVWESGLHCYAGGEPGPRGSTSGRWSLLAPNETGTISRRGRK